MVAQIPPSAELTQLLKACSDSDRDALARLILDPADSEANDSGSI